MMIAREQKIKEANRILENLKTQMMEILWEIRQNHYNNSRMMIPWIQEEAEYAIKKLKIPGEDENYYLIMIERIVGEYTENL